MFFLDDFMFKDNPVSMIGQSLYIREREFVAKFIEVFEEMYNQISQSRKIAYMIKSDFPMTVPVISRLEVLYRVMIQKGDPHISDCYRIY